MAHTESFWRIDARLSSFPQLSGEQRVDVAVVGGGIAGLTAALLLQRRGKRVALIEARRLGAGETGNTTAHLTEVLDRRYHALESKFGQRGAQLAAESSRCAIDTIERLASEAGLEYSEFTRNSGYLFAESPEQVHELEREYEAFQRVGTLAEWADDTGLPFQTQRAIRISRQAQFHPLKYLSRLCDAFVAEGGQVFEQTTLLDIHDGAPCLLHTDQGDLKADDALILTNVPVSNRVAIHTKVAAFRSYALAGPMANAALDANLYWDLDDPYHYIRTATSGDRSFVIVGGADHKTGQEPQTEDPFDTLERYARARLPGFEKTAQWSGQIIEPADGLPFIGKNTDAQRIYVATGFAGNGMTFGTLSALILADTVLGRPNEWAELYDATRIKPLAQGRQYIAENIDFPTHIIRDRFSKGDVEHYEDVPRGDGCLVRRNGKMQAVYRDPSGGFHVRSAVCPHLGCYVRWNMEEKTWDCPCHGSRFNKDGAMLNGPATRDLDAVMPD
ncbi:MAG: FAD-dependent oxidoreductase [Myxococcales bacterium]|nr:FAD-dependent oxidoreductase [Myxococcales bacterium]